MPVVAQYALSQYRYRYYRDITAFPQGKEKSGYEPVALKKLNHPSKDLQQSLHYAIEVGGSA